MSVLFNILFVSLQKGVSTAYNIFCAQKLKGTGQGQAFYAEDNDGFFGKAGSFDSVPSDDFIDRYCRWVPDGPNKRIVFYGMEISQYLNLDIDDSNWEKYMNDLDNSNKMDYLLCPAESGEITAGRVIEGSLAQWQAVKSTQLVNGKLLGYNRLNSENTYAGDSRLIKRPDSLLMFSDSKRSSLKRYIWSWGESKTYSDMIFEDGYNITGKAALEEERHGGLLYENNVYFVDGHAKLVTIDDFDSIHISE
jgi:prepilin-type processing-associated H-X9-DG protein